jgi:hypothetical protein
MHSCRGVFHFKRAMNSNFNHSRRAMRFNIFRSVALCYLALAAVFFVLTPMQAQQTLGSLNGTVTDSSGAAIPGALVTAIDAEIGVTRTTTSQSNGYYQIFNLPIGKYAVKVTHDGFETSVTNGIAVQEARATTANTALKVGKVTESVQVTANPLLNATDATNGYTLDTSQIEITPLATGSFTQLAVLSPGVNAELLSNLDTNSGLGNQPIWANGQRDTSNTFQVNGVDSTNLFNGKSSSGSNSQRYNFNIGSASTVGGSFSVGTSVYGSNGNSLPSPPPEFIAEERVNASMYDAQQGATSGAQIDINTKTGTNSWHYSLYGTYANNALNAAPFFFKQEYQLTQQGLGVLPASMANPWLRRWDSGFTAGGPVKTNKLFFFVAYQRRMNEDDATGLSQLNVPTALTNDRSSTGLLAADSTWGGNATSVDPVALAIMQTTLPNGQYLIPSSQNSNTWVYGVPNVFLQGTSRLTSDQATVSLDYDATKNDRVSAKYFYQNAPVTRPYGFSQTGGFPVSAHNGSQVFSLGNTIAIGPRLNWEQRIGFVREGTFSNYTQTFAGGSLGVGGEQTASNIQNTGVLSDVLPGIEFEYFGADDSLNAPPAYLGPAGVPGAFVDMGYYQSRVNPSTNVIFTAGKHTIVAGGGYNYTQLNITNDRTGHSQLKVKGFDNFLKGYVNSSDVLESIDPTSGRNNADRYYRTNELSGYLQDKWQARTNLSITAGLRYDYHGGMTEKFGNMLNFNPALYNVTGNDQTPDGFTVTNSGIIIAGNNKQNATQGVSNSTLNGRQWGFSPRIGFAWSPAKFHSNLVISGGAGLYYDRGELFSYLSQPAGGTTGGPFGVTEAEPFVSVANGLSNAGTHANKGGLTLENPLGDLGLQTSVNGGIYVAPSANPGVINSALQTQLNQMTGDSKYYGPNCGGTDSQEGYLDCTPTLNFGVYDRNNVLPYTMNYTLNVQWQPTNTVAITLGYAGNRGRHSVIPIPINEPVIPGVNGAAQNIWGETSAYGFEVLNENSTPDGYDYAPIAVEPWNTADGGNTDFRTPYVGFSPNAADFKTVGVSAYDALETHVEKRLSHNFQVGGSYTWSHSLDEQSDIGLFFTGDNPNRLRDSWASSDFDRTNVFTGNFQVDIPNAAKPSSLLSYFSNDWHIGGAGTLQSGEPYSLYEFYGAVGSINFGDYPTLMNPVLGIKDPTHPGSAFTGNKGAFRGPGGSYIPTLDPTQVAINYIAPGSSGVPVSTGSDPSDIYETSFNSGQRNIFRQPAQKRLDLSIRKGFKITEKIKAQYEMSIFNVTNTTSLDIPQDQAQIRQNSACSSYATSYAIANGYNCAPGSYYYVNYGQIVTGNNPTDQQSALHNLDQIPYATGSGKTSQLPLTIPVGTTDSNGVIRCYSVYAVVGTSYCPNNAANFGSVTGTIGGNRAFVMGFHITY